MIHLGLVGYPLGHSHSPKIHAEMLTQCGLAGEYQLFPVPPEDCSLLEKKLVEVRKGKLRGLNITIPHKQNVLPLVDTLSQFAQLAGAVNTVYIKDNQLVGENSDLPGFRSDLMRNFYPEEEDLAGKKVIVLGAGGAARAVAGALVLAGCVVVIAARRESQTEEVVRHLDGYKEFLIGTHLSAEGLKPYSKDTDLIVNATPAGMHPETGRSPWPKGLSLPKGARAYDLVYNPKETQFMRDARDAGLHTAGGMGMLIEQAVIAFELWTGCTVDRESLKKSLEDV